MCDGRIKDKTNTVTVPMEQNTADNNSDSDVENWTFVDRQPVDHEHCQVDGSAEDRDSNITASDEESLEVIDDEEELKERREYFNNHVLGEEDDMPNIDDGVDEVLPLLVGSKERKYVHHQNPQINSHLNLALFVVVAGVLGLGFGHFLGLHQDCHQKQLTRNLILNLELENQLLRYYVGQVISSDDRPLSLHTLEHIKSKLATLKINNDIMLTEYHKNTDWSGIQDHNKETGVLLMELNMTKAHDKIPADANIKTVHKIRNTTEQDIAQYHTYKKETVRNIPLIFFDASKRCKDLTSTKPSLRNMGVAVEKKALSDSQGISAKLDVHENPQVGKPVKLETILPPLTHELSIQNSNPLDTTDNSNSAEYYIHMKNDENQLDFPSMRRLLQTGKPDDAEKINWNINAQKESQQNEYSQYTSTEKVPEVHNNREEYYDTRSNQNVPENVLTETLAGNHFETYKNKGKNERKNYHHGIQDSQYHYKHRESYENTVKKSKTGVPQGKQDTKKYYKHQKKEKCYKENRYAENKQNTNKYFYTKGKMPNEHSEKRFVRKDKYYTNNKRLNQYNDKKNDIRKEKMYSKERMRNTYHDKHHKQTWDSFDSNMKQMRYKKNRASDKYYEGGKYMEVQDVYDSKEEGIIHKFRQPKEYQPNEYKQEWRYENKETENKNSKLSENEYGNHREHWPINGDGETRDNMSGSWFLKRSKGREEQRANHHRSEWMFERAQARSAKRTAVDESKWYFQRAQSRDRCRQKPSATWCHSDCCQPHADQQSHKQTPDPHYNDRNSWKMRRDRWSRKLQKRFVKVAQWMKNSFAQLNNKFSFQSQR